MITDTTPHKATGRAISEIIVRVMVTGRVTHEHMRAARTLLADSGLDLSRVDPLDAATLIAIADGEMREIVDYLEAAMGDPDTQWRQGIRAQAESRIFGYLDRQGRM